jgi:hypothetical protein
MKRFSGLGGFLVVWATKYIIIWSGMCVLCSPVNLLLSQNNNISLRGLRKSARRHTCALERAWHCFRYKDIYHILNSEQECTLLRLPSKMAVHGYLFLERQRDYMRRDLFMGKLDPEKCSQRLQEMNRYLDFIPTEKVQENKTHPIVKAYNKALPYYDIISIMGRSIPLEWTVNLLALGKEPLKFKDLNDQLATYCQQWQSDQQNQTMIKMEGKLPGKSRDGKRKNKERNTHNGGGGRSSGRQGNNGHGGRGRERGGRGGRNNDNSDHLKKVVCYNCDKKGHYSTDCRTPKKNGNEESNMVSKADSINLFQSSLKDMLSNKENQKNDKTNMELDDESLDMTVFDKLMEGKHNESVSENDDDSMSIENTYNLFHF